MVHSVVFMSSSDSTPGRRRALGAALAALAGLAAMVPLRAAGDVRALSITAAALEAADAPRRIVSAAVETGFHAVLIPIALDGVDPVRAAGIDAIIRDGHARGLRVHAALRVTVAAPPGELPVARSHVLYQHPEWLMVPRELAVEMLALDPRMPDYIGRLARWTRANSGRVDGIYLSPLHPEAIDYVAGAVARIVTRFAVDGVHLEGLRFPGRDFDYSRGALDAFRAGIRASLADGERARLDAVETIDPFGYAEELPGDWQRFRTSRLTALVARLRTTIRAVRPEAIVSAAALAGAERASGDYLQDWRTWLDNRFVDALSADGGGSTTLLSSYDTLLDSPAASVIPGAAGSQ